MPINRTPLEADFGFKSPGFSVDEQGNVFVRSLTYTTDQGTEIDADFLVTADANNLVFSGQNGTNPTITLNKGTTYTFGLDLRDDETGEFLENGFYVLSAANVPYTTGVKHFNVDGTESVGDPFNRTTGILSLFIPFDAPAVLYYSLGSGTLQGQFTIAEPQSTPVGSFQNLIVTSTLTATDDNVVINLSPGGPNGTVTINPNNGGSLSNMIVNATNLNASTSVSLTPTTSLQINPGTTGEINNTNIGQTIPAAGAFTVLEASAGSINNVAIGLTTPTSAAFTGATVQTVATTNSVTNKKYVDSTASALAIALGT